MTAAREGPVLVVRWRGDPAARWRPAGDVTTWAAHYRPLEGDLDGLAIAGVATRRAAASPPGLVDAVRKFAPGSAVQATVYGRRIGGVPGVDFLVRGGPVSLFGCDVRPESAAEWNRYYDERHFPGVLRQPIYVGGARFERLAVLRSDLGATDPDHLVVYELVSAAALDQLEPDRMPPEARAELEDWKVNGLPHVENPLRLRALAVDPADRVSGWRAGSCAG